MRPKCFHIFLILVFFASLSALSHGGLVFAAASTHGHLLLGQGRRSPRVTSSALSQKRNSIPAPTWWNGTCDDVNYYNGTNPHTHAVPLGSSYRGLITCGPLPRNGAPLNTVFFPAGSQVPISEWTSTELAMRYLYLAYGVMPYTADGGQVVWNYSGTLFQKIPNQSGSHVAPQPGDVMSYGSQVHGGHVSIVIQSQIDNNTGNGTVTVIDEDGFLKGKGKHTVTNWFVDGTNDGKKNVVSGWLHDPAALAPLMPQSGSPGISVQVSGVGIGASETVAINFDTTQVGTTTSDSQGNFSTTITVPQSAPQGAHFIQAIGQTSGLATDRAVFLVGPLPMFSEFPTPTSSSYPTGIAPGPDGNLWFTEASANKIGKLTPGGVFNEYPLPSSNSYPAQITAGPDGNLWFTEESGNKIGQITPGGTITEFPLPTGFSKPWGITAGPDGNLWFTEEQGSQIGQITPGGTITEFLLPNGGSYPVGITAGADGNLWFTELFGDKIGRITPGGVITEFPVPTSNSEPDGITAGADGNLWFTEETSGKIGSITTAGSYSEYPLPSHTSAPIGITSGSDGNLWFTEFNGDRIGRITTAGVISEFTIPTSFSGPFSIAAGPDRNLWFTEFNRSQIGRVNLV